MYFLKNNKIPIGVFRLDAIFHNTNAQLRISNFNINITRPVCLLDILTYLAHLTHKSVWLDFESRKNL